MSVHMGPKLIYLNKKYPNVSTTSVLTPIIDQSNVYCSHIHTLSVNSSCPISAPSAPLLSLLQQNLYTTLPQLALYNPSSFLLALIFFFGIFLHYYPYVHFTVWISYDLSETTFIIHVRICFNLLLTIILAFKNCYKWESLTAGRTMWRTVG